MFALVAFRPSEVVEGGDQVEAQAKPLALAAASFRQDAEICCPYEVAYTKLCPMTDLAAWPGYACLASLNPLIFL